MRSSIGSPLVKLLLFFLAIQGVSAAEDKRPLAEIKTAFEPVIRSIWQDILAGIKHDERETLLNTRIDLTLDDTPFGFFAGQEKTGTDRIVVTVGGLRTLDMSTLAIAMALTGVADGNWAYRWHFMVRERLRHGDRFIPDPTGAGGIKPSDLPARTFETCVPLRNAGIAFILAHEAAHILFRHRSDRRANESPASRAERLRSQEAAADRWACDTLLRMRLAPTASALSFASMAVIYEDPGSDRTLATHPSNAERLKLVARATLENLAAVNWQGQNIEEVRKNVAALLSAADSFANGEVLAGIERDLREKGLRLR